MSAPSPAALPLASRAWRRRGMPLVATLALLLAFSLAGCGKKNEPVPPPGAKITYPQAYPRE